MGELKNGLKIPEAAFQKFLTEAGERYAFAITTALEKLGTEAVEKVRDRSGEASWYDRTGNLRSSIGASVYDHGAETIRTGLTGNGSAGIAAGNAFLSSLAQKYADVYALVVCAAMDYAEYVEAMDNKDVLASTELWVRANIDREIQAAVDEVTEQLNKTVIK